MSIRVHPRAPEFIHSWTSAVFFPLSLKQWFSVRFDSIRLLCSTGYWKRTKTLASSLVKRISSANETSTFFQFHKWFDGNKVSCRIINASRISKHSVYPHNTCRSSTSINWQGVGVKISFYLTAKYVSSIQNLTNKSKCLELTENKQPTRSFVICQECCQQRPRGSACVKETFCPEGIPLYFMFASP